jgi:8-oxo-dGTP pyrophosphatase MutT (NUDIX family)
MARIRQRIFQAWFRFRRPMTLGVRALVERSDGKVLLVRHTYTKGLYLPGGGVEKGEIASVSLLRELKEEGGVELTGTPRLVGIYSNEAIFPNDHVVFYHLRPGDWVGGEATSVGEISETVWADPHALPEDTTPATQRRVAEIFAGGPNDGYW